MPRLPWLDQLTFREIEKIKSKKMAESPFMHLTVIFQTFDYPVLYCDTGIDLPNLSGGVSVLDAEILFHDNLCENKHHKLTRSNRSDHDLKPNTFNRDRLAMLTERPPQDLITPDDKDLIWRYRFYLTQVLLPSNPRY